MREKRRGNCACAKSLSFTNELRRSAPPSPTTDELIKNSEAICERITVVTMPRANRTLDEVGLSPDEFTVVDSALKAYVVSLGQSIPPSEERDEIMRGCENLRIHLMAGSTRNAAKYAFQNTCTWLTERHIAFSLDEKTGVWRLGTRVQQKEE